MWRNAVLFGFLCRIATSFVGQEGVRALNEKKIEQEGEREE
ncbi:hypothetical protein B4113_1831 [Geobacillus sp. B4113_201601]|nr:hypothetical protein B4113_1831 [Geobacillus sp. B4113_201601]